MKNCFLLMLVGICCVGLGFRYSAGTTRNDDKKSIKDVMKECMKGPLGKKVASGEASNEEKMKLLDDLIDLVENDPPQGDPTEWKMQAGKVMMNAAKVVVGRENAGSDLKESMNCTDCHNKFRPKPGR